MSLGSILQLKYTKKNQFGNPAGVYIGRANTTFVKVITERRAVPIRELDGSHTSICRK